jgi:hypothetical protein
MFEPRAPDRGSKCYSFLSVARVHCLSSFWFPITFTLVDVTATIKVVTLTLHPSTIAFNNYCHYCWCHYCHSWLCSHRCQCSACCQLQLPRGMALMQFLPPPAPQSWVLVSTLLLLPLLILLLSVLAPDALLMMKIKSRQDYLREIFVRLKVGTPQGSTSVSPAYIAKKGVWQGCWHQSLQSLHANEKLCWHQSWCTSSYHQSRQFPYANEGLCLHQSQVFSWASSGKLSLPGL